MDKCQKKELLYNPLTNRCYKSCEKKNKVTHPITKKCRKPCNTNKTRRIEDFRCVKPNTIRQKKRNVNSVKIKAENKNKTKKIPMSTKKETPQEKIQEEKMMEWLAPNEEKEQLIQLPLKKELVKNFTFLDEFLQKGKGVDTIQYQASDRVSEIITIYFYKKYKQDCPMYPIKTHSSFDILKVKNYLKKNEKYYTKEFLKQQLLKNHKASYSEWDKDKFLTNLKLCLETGEQLIIVPVRLIGHLNMLFIKVATREIIRFEPHGYAFKNGMGNTDKKVNTFLEKLTNDINKYFNLLGNKKFTYKAPSEICPRYTSTMPSNFYPGFQSMEGREKKLNKRVEGGGFCLLWSWFFAECVMSNPEMDIKEVYEEAYKALNTNEGKFATIIRGYFLSINEELVKMNKTFRIDKHFIDKNSDMNDVFLEYLDKNRESLQNKHRKPFQDGGVKGKKNFILPEANPKVEKIN